MKITENELALILSALQIVLEKKELQESTKEIKELYNKLIMED